MKVCVDCDGDPRNHAPEIISSLVKQWDADPEDVIKAIAGEGAVLIKSAENEGFRQRGLRLVSNRSRMMYERSIHKFSKILEDKLNAAADSD